ncbi:hypothetical protein E2C01_064050 [Portunus trituberculatus]|uniref:Uncharacterized protein n=1 Tax=Portunus trituberculatus TaxID=210409 RepID=A0A5B7HJA9_PORTR|nr:hypothetical protein [Portunus trituberculatus]
MLYFDYRTSELVTAVAGVLQKDPCRASFRQLLISRLPDLLSAFAEEVKGIRADFKFAHKSVRPQVELVRPHSRVSQFAH